MFCVAAKSKFNELAETLMSALWFLKRDSLYETGTAYKVRYDPPNGLLRTNMRLGQHPVALVDIRKRQSEFSFSQNRFTIMNLNCGLTRDDFEKVLNLYLPEAAHRVKRLLGADHVQVLDYVVRSYQLLLRRPGDIEADEKV